MSKKLLGGIILGGLGGICFFFIFTYIQMPTQEERIANYFEWVRRDPLMQWSGADLNNVQYALSYLEESRKNISSFNKEYIPQSQYHSELELYPIEYLRYMLKLETKRRSLIETQSKSGEIQLQELEEYHHLLLTTIEKEISYLDSMIPVLKTRSEFTPQKGLRYALGSTDFTYFIDQYEQYRQELYAVQTQEQRRWNCLTRNITCQKAQYPELHKVPPVVSLSTTTTQAVVTQAVRNEWYSTQTPRGLALLSSGSCHQPRQTSLYYTGFLETNSDGVSTFQADELSTMLMHPIPVGQKVNDYEQALESLGAEDYLLQSDNNNYMCPDVAWENTRLTSLLLVDQEARELLKLLSEVFNKHESIHMPALERDIRELRLSISNLENEVLYEDRLHKIVRKIRDILVSHERDMLVKILGEELVSHAEWVLLSYYSGTYRLDSHIAQLVYNNTAIIDYASRSPWNYYDELLFIRNGQKLLLGGTNPSVITTRLPLMQTPASTTAPWLVSYEEVGFQKEDTKELLDMLVKSQVAEKTLVEITQTRNFLPID